MAKQKHLTNEQFVKRQMQFSRHGALMQAFIITALQKYAAQCIEAGPDVFESGLLSGTAWVGCAHELKEALDANYGGK